MTFFSRLLLASCLCALHGPVEAATLTVEINGPNSGNVSLQPLGLLCSGSTTLPTTTCVFTIAPGTVFRLSANSPATPGIFHDGTIDAAACATSTCNLTINNDSFIRATFGGLGPYVSLQIALGGDGKGEVGADNNRCQNFELGFSACTVYYGPGSEVKLEGRSMPGNIFVNFAGGTLGAAGCAATPCVFILNDPTSVSANFARMTSLAVQPSYNDDQGRTHTRVHGDRHVQQRRDPVDIQRPRDLEHNAFDERGQVFPRGGSRERPVVHHRWCEWRLYFDALHVSPAQPGGNVQPCGSTAWLTDSWTTMAPMSTPREGLAVAVVNGRIYAMGGHTTGGAAVASTEAYDPATNAWTTRNPMSAPRAGFAAAVINNIIYAVGGGDSRTRSKRMIRHPIPGRRRRRCRPRAGVAAAAVNGKLYAIGVPNTSIVEEYDPNTNTWTTKTPMPTARSGLAASAIDGLIDAVGGRAALGRPGPWTSTIQRRTPGQRWRRCRPRAARSRSGCSTVASSRRADSPAAPA